MILSPIVAVTCNKSLSSGKNIFQALKSRCYLLLIMFLSKKNRDSPSNHNSQAATDFLTNCHSLNIAMLKSGRNGAQPQNKL